MRLSVAQLYPDAPEASTEHYVCIHYDERIELIPTPNSHEDAEGMVRQLFESTNLSTLELSTDSIAISRGRRVVLRPMIWGAVRPYLADIYVRELEPHAGHEELNEEEENDVEIELQAALPEVSTVEHNVSHLAENMQLEPVDSQTSTVTDPVQNHPNGKGEENMNMKRRQASGSGQVSTVNGHARERDRTNTPYELNAQGKRKHNVVSDEEEDDEWPTSRRRVNTGPQAHVEMETTKKNQSHSVRNSSEKVSSKTVSGSSTGSLPQEQRPVSPKVKVERTHMKIAEKDRELVVPPKSGLPTMSKPVPLLKSREQPSMEDVQSRNRGNSKTQAESEEKFVVYMWFGEEQRTFKVKPSYSIAKVLVTACRTFQVSQVDSYSISKIETGRDENGEENELWTLCTSTDKLSDAGVRQGDMLVLHENSMQLSDSE